METKIDVLLEEKFEALRGFRSRFQLEESSNVLTEIEIVFDKIDIKKHSKKYSLFTYEKAYLLLLESRYQESIKEFRNSANFSKSIGDDLRWWVGDFQYWLVSYYGDMITATDMLHKLNELERQFYEIVDIPDADQGLFFRFEFTLKLMIANISFESSDFDFDILSERIRRDNHMTMGVSRKQPAFVIYEKRLEARNFINIGAYERAIAIFSTFLDPVIFDGFTQFELRDEYLFEEFDFYHFEEIGRDYRDLARSLELSRIEGWQDAHKKVTNIGLDLPSGCCNLRFQNHIKQDLAKITY